MTSPASLRDLYNAPSSAWSFVPEAPPIHSSPNNASSSTSPPQSSTPYQWSRNRPAPNSIFSLSPSLAGDESGNVDAINLLKSLVASAVLEYSSNALVMPWEVAKTLLQVQWIPRDAVEMEEPEGERIVEEEEEEVMSESSNDDSYFADPSNDVSSRAPAPKPVDEQGYVLRRSILEEGTRPEYIIPVEGGNGVWDMIKRISHFKGEGWLSLWKGLLTSCLLDVLSANLQPVFQNFLQSVFLPSLSPFDQPPLLLPVASHLLTGLLLSPLDLVRTRLIAQSFIPRHRTYTGPIDALAQIHNHEGGLKGIYLHPHLLIPTITDSSLRPLLSLALPTVLASYFGSVTEDSHPVMWAFAEMLGNFAGLLVTLPFETVRRRLQVQVRGTAKPIKACVETRPAPYNGVVDALWHILTEERSDAPTRRRRSRRRSQAGKGKEKEGMDVRVEHSESWRKNTGIAQLYRGLGLRFGASVVVFMLAVLTGGEERDSGWAEI